MYEAIAMSGGAHRAVAHLGALAYLEDHGLSDNVHSYAGSSGGAVVAALCSMAGARDLLRLYGEEDVSAPRAVHNPFKERGLVSMGFRSLERRLEAATGKGRATFRDVKRATGKGLFVSAFCVDDGSTVFFGPDDDVAVVDAVRASTAIPLLVPPVRLGGRDYVDGAIAAYLPTDALPRDACSLGLLLESPPCSDEGLRPYLHRLVVAVLKNTNAGRTNAGRTNAGRTNAESADEDSADAARSEVCKISFEEGGGNVLIRQTPQRSAELFRVGYGAMEAHVTSSAQCCGSWRRPRS